MRKPDTTMTMTLVRVPLTLVAAFAFHVAMSPPSTFDPDTPRDRHAAIRATARLIIATLTKVRPPIHTHTYHTYAHPHVLDWNP